MSKDVKAKLEDRRKVLEEEFSTTEEERKGLVEKGKLIQQRLSQIKTRQAQLQGAFSEVKELLGEGPLEQVKELGKEKKVGKK